jgi:hypothetical protein
MKKTNQRWLVLGICIACEMRLVDVSGRREGSYKGKTSLMIGMKGIPHVKLA